MLASARRGGNKSFDAVGRQQLIEKQYIYRYIYSMDRSALYELRTRASRACALLRALAHEDRLVLLCQLSAGEYTVGELEARLGIVQPTLSQQLGVLRREGLVDTRRDGKYIHYRIASDDALALLRTLHARFCNESDGVAS